MDCNCNRNNMNGYPGRNQCPGGRRTGVMPSPMPVSNAGCGCDKDIDMPIAMAYVPWQRWNNIYEPCKALMRGTMFPELDKPFLGGGLR